MRARVYRSSKREFDCKIDGSGEFVVATALGNLLKGRDNQIVVGDYVELENIGEEPGHKIVSVNKRHGEVFRIIVREAKKKVTAANIDLLVVMTSVSSPVYKRGIIDRFLVRAYQWNIKPIVVFNKMDEYDSSTFDICFETDRLMSQNIDCYEISAIDKGYTKKSLNFGYSELVEELRGKTALFLGQSGVGKSELISTLSGREVELRTNEVGKKGKGTHTTSWSEIIDLGDFVLVDSPGIRSLSLEDIPSEDFISYFPDLVDTAIQCKFVDCNHGENAKGCAFRTLDFKKYQNQLVLSRLESFIRIYDELCAIPHWANRITGKRET